MQTSQQCAPRGGWMGGHNHTLHACRPPAKIPDLFRTQACGGLCVCFEEPRLRGHGHAKSVRRHADMRPINAVVCAHIAELKQHTPRLLLEPDDSRWYTKDADARHQVPAHSPSSVSQSHIMLGSYLISLQTSQQASWQWVRGDTATHSTNAPTCQHGMAGACMNRQIALNAADGCSHP